MSLQLIWDGEVHMFYSLAIGRGHHTARMARRLQNGIYLVEIGPRGGERRNKLIFKLAREPDEITVLEQEARLYENQLRDLRGKFVPEYYGIFHGDVMGSRVAGMLLEYCIGSPNDKLDDEEKNRKIMLAACAVHSAGLLHTNLLDGHHFVISGRDVKIVDFSNAVRHRCYNRTPTLQPGKGGDSSGCKELLALEKTYGIYSGGPIGNPFQVLWRKYIE
ncbi:hypothetical protein C8J57DRAFT_1490235 [Mycena rebaudengoi]|nr:hypothetical protein C8J57DRAFT_1490235 [Mycena rebaudengoi]